MFQDQLSYIFNELLIIEYSSSLKDLMEVNLAEYIISKCINTHSHL